MAARNKRKRLVNWLSLKWASIRFPLSALVGWISLSIGIVSGGASLLQGVFGSSSASDYIWSGAIAMIALVSFGAFTCSTFRRSSAVSVANTLPQQSSATDTLRETRNFLRMHVTEARASKKEVPQTILMQTRSHIQEALTEYATVFSVSTGSRCRMCLKLIGLKSEPSGGVPDVDDFTVYTLARDMMSARENAFYDEKRFEENLDLLKDNSDFIRLWSQDLPDEGIFFASDLREMDGYESSSLNYHWNVLENPNRNRRADWPLWYTSAIVWPIRQEKNEKYGIGEYKQHGFLSVDCRMPKAFDRDRETHIAIGKILANSLYPVLDLYTEV